MPSAVPGLDLVPNLTWQPLDQAACLAALASVAERADRAAPLAEPGVERAALELLAETARVLHAFVRSPGTGGGWRACRARVARMSHWLELRADVDPLASAAVALCWEVGAAVDQLGPDD